MKSSKNKIPRSPNIYHKKRITKRCNTQYGKEPHNNRSENLLLTLSYQKVAVLISNKISFNLPCYPIFLGGLITQQKINKIQQTLTRKFLRVSNDVYTKFMNKLISWNNKSAS